MSEANARTLPDAEIQALDAWLAGHVDGYAGPLTVSRCKGGQSNPTWRLHTPGRDYVMRAKPAPKAKLLPSAHAIEREYRVQAALQGSGVPVARMCGLCEDESVIGRAFYVMDHVEGRILWDPTLPGMDASGRAAMYDELNRVIAVLHTVDHAALGLADYGKAGNYFERQVARWTTQYRASEIDRIDAMERLIDWLPRHVPAQSDDDVSIVHGDYRLDNVIFHPDEPRILAVIDWELSTLGHRTADFAYHMLTWHMPQGLFRGLGGVDLASLGIPGEDAYAAAYARRTGRDATGDWNYCLAYNVFRLAAIMQGIAKRAEAGIASSPQALEYGRQVAPLADLGWRFAQRAGGA